jgi:hypothetical protein
VFIDREFVAMRRSSCLPAVLVVITGFTGTAIADPELPKHFTDEQLIEVLQSEGYRAVEKSDDRVLSIKIDGYTFYLYVYDDDDLQLYFGLTGYEVTAADMNEWNRTNRLSRAYLDDVDDPVLEADLLANAGYSAAQLREWLSVFNSSAREFHQFVTEAAR